MKILIADDEMLERKAMKKFITNNFKDMNVIGEAENGRRAIELASILKPDIIFMDIKMPGINGLEAIEQIQVGQPTIKFILVSAYDTFDYAKQAMQFGIKDYILKPGKKEEIVKALFRVKKEIVKEAKIEEEKWQSVQLLQEKLLGKLMISPIQSDTFDLQGQLFPLFKSGCFFVLGSDLPYDLQRIKKTLEKHLSTTFVLYEVNDLVIVLLLSADLINKADQLILARKLHIEFGESLFIGIGFPRDSLKNLPSSYREAYVACFQLKTGNKSNYGFSQEETEQSRSEELIAKIVMGVENGNYDEVIINIKENGPVFKAADKENLFIAIQNVLSKRNISIEKSSMSSLQSNKDWHTYLNVCCMKINEFYYSKQSMSRAKKYIEAHYSKGITLEDVAALVKLSPNYFSSQFREEFDETFIGFLTRTRMKNARELIEENVYSLKEISFMVGYNDPNYFSRVFKRHYQSSPRQFQDSIFEK